MTSNCNVETGQSKLNTKNKATFSFGRKKTMINGQSYQCQEKDASVIYDAMDGAWKTEEMSDQKIQSMGKW